MSETDDRADTQIPPLMTLGGRPWAVSRDVLPRLAEAHRLPAAAEWARLGARTAPRPKVARRSESQRAGGAVAVIPLTGVLTPRGSFLSFLFGGAAGGLQGFREEFRAAVQSPDIGAIVLDVDSPGGLVDLVPETAAEIRDARGSKPIVAVANTLAASGAYWIATQADELVVTPSGDVGSVGVYVVHEDWSVWNEQKGIAPSYIYAGQYKTEGNPDEPLSDDARQAWQQEIDDLYAMFVADIAAGRGVSADVVRADYGKGRTMQAASAVEAGMADRIDTIEAVIGALLAPGSSGTAAALAGRHAQITPVHAEEAAAASAGDEPTGDEPDDADVPDPPDAGAGDVPDPPDPAEPSVADAAAIAAVLIG